MTKMARMNHLDIYSISYGQKKGRESNWQFVSRPLKLGIDSIPVRPGEVRHTVEKLLIIATTLV
jgi:hypothetical protein